MERKQGESYKSFLTRVVDAKKNNRITYEEMGNSIVDDNRWSSENFRKFFYIIQPVLENLNEDANITDNEILQEIEMAKEELYRERVKLRDRKRELNKALTQEARFENLREVMCERLDDIGYLPRETYHKPLSKRKGATLICSDWHIGIKVDNQFNEYNIDIAQDRVRQLTNKVIQYCKQHEITDLNVELCGDFVSGTIHTGIRVDQEEDIVQQIIDCSEMISNMVNDIAEKIENVTVYSVFGNHGRISSNKNEGINRENYERLIYHYVKSRVKNVKFINSYGEDFIKYKAFDKTFVIAHGDKDKLSTAVDSYSKIFKERIDELHIGHYHNFAVTNEFDIPVIVNGSLIGSDDYSVSIRKVCKPSQTFIVYGEDSCIYNLILD